VHFKRCVQLRLVQLSVAFLLDPASNILSFKREQRHELATKGVLASFRGDDRALTDLLDHGDEQSCQPERGLSVPFIRFFRRVNFDLLFPKLLQFSLCLLVLLGNVLEDLTDGNQLLIDLITKYSQLEQLFQRDLNLNRRDLPIRCNLHRECRLLFERGLSEQEIGRMKNG